MIMEQKVLFEKEVTSYLNIPSIPLKEWDKKSAFKKSVAVVNTYSGMLAYAVASFDPQKDQEIRVVKTFSQEVFTGIEKILIVPDYMDTNVESFDLDEASKKKAQEIIEEAKEIENEGTEKTIKDINELPEWIFEDIKNKEEASAWLRAYNKRNKIRGDVPKKDETIKLRLYAIYTEMNSKKQ